MTRKFILWTSYEDVDKLFQLGRLAHNISISLSKETGVDGVGRDVTGDWGAL